MKESDYRIIGNKTDYVLNNSFNSDMSDSDESNNKMNEAMIQM